MAQPFRMVVEINGKQRSHVPDYLLSTVDGSLACKAARLWDWAPPTLSEHAERSA